MGSSPILPDFYLADSALHKIYVFRAEFEDPFNSLTCDSIIENPKDIVKSYVTKIRVLRERQIREGEGGTVLRHPSLKKYF